jgi:hypothetical protein
MKVPGTGHINDRCQAPEPQDGEAAGPAGGAGIFLGL